MYRKVVGLGEEIRYLRYSNGLVRRRGKGWYGESYVYMVEGLVALC